MLRKAGYNAHKIDIAWRALYINCNVDKKYPIMNHTDSELNRAILNTVVYADIFDYPLTLTEIHRYLTGACAPLEVVSTLAAAHRFLRLVGGYYTLPGREAIVSIRERREKEAVRLWREARSYGRIIAGLPFVRMVAITGSLAMNNVEADADIDYLLVTTPGRLWICRLLTLVITRLAAFRGISLCPNFLLTQNALEIPEHSLYAAHEFAQMVPLSGLDLYLRMRTLNPWVWDFLPNADGLPVEAGDLPGTDPAFGPRPLLEWILMSPPGAWLERWEMERKIRKLSLENLGNPEANFSADLCKGHSNRHGQRTVLSLNERLTRLELELVR